MLDVAIGLILVFLLVSLICTALAEVIEGFLKQRASSLLQGIKELLQDPEGTGLAKKFYEHPLIAGLYKEDFKQNKVKNLPSYIPARIFSLALIDIIQPTTTNVNNLNNTVTPEEEKKMQQQKDTIEAVKKS